MNSSPAVSVIVPIYNVEEYLAECLDSLVQQTLEDIEILLIDDGTPDNSDVIARDYADRYENVFYFLKENGGLGDARNYGVARARGEYLAFVDSDDRVALDIYEKMYVAAKAHDCDMAICNVLRCNSEKTWRSPLHSKAFKDLKALTTIHENNNLIYDTTAWNKLLRRDFYTANGFSFPVGMLYEDIPVTIPMHCKANRVAVIYDYGYYWRERDRETVSITQQTNTVKNLEDRIKAMKMLDAFFAENGTEQQLLDAWHKKIFSTDLAIFVRESPDIDRETAEYFRSAIQAYIDEAGCEAGLSCAPVYTEQYFEYFLAGQFDKVLDVRDYTGKFYSNKKVRETDQGLEIKLPDDLFTVEHRNVNDEFALRLCTKRIDKIKIDEASISFFGHLYRERVSVRAGQQSVQGYLLDVRTLKKIPLQSSAYSRKVITKSHGKKYDAETGKLTSYNYDGSGFKLTLDLRMLSKEELAERGEYILVVEYANRFFTGVEPMRRATQGARRNNDGAAVYCNGVHAAVSFEDENGLRLFIEKDEPLVDAYTVDGSDMTLYVSGVARELLMQSGTHDEAQALGVSEPGAYRVNCAALNEGVEYSLKESNASQDEDACSFRVRPVLFARRTLRIHECADAVLVFNALHDHRVRFEKLPFVTELSSVRCDDTIVTFNTVCRGLLPEADRVVFAELMVADSTVQDDTMLCRVPVVNKTGTVSAAFCVDFAQTSNTENLFQADSGLYVRYCAQDCAIASARMIATRHFEHKIELSTMRVTFRRERDGSCFMTRINTWQGFANSDSKRQSLVAKHYPTYMECPIDERMIVFESTWGKQFSCNPRALYEYIDKHYPNYTCVWSFRDERTPITGNALRVRQGSLEYYYCLARTKYLVNNVNFPQAYTKRSGQIEIQTMHGTPLKTFGYEVPGELETDEAREKFAERCGRWDYLVVQGEFTENKSDDFFKYRKAFLRTGYPRTDRLFDVSQDEIDSIKKRIGIPEDKRVVLYAPTWRVRHKFDMKLDFEKMKHELGDDFVLLVRIHHYSSSGYTVPTDNEFVFDVTDVQPMEDLYLASDMMITDYSSAMFDYALLDKPMLFFVYDLDEYASASRGIYVDFKEEAPGRIAYTGDEVIAGIKQVYEHDEAVADRVARFKKKFLTYERSDSTRAVIEEGLQLLEAASDPLYATHGETLEKLRKTLTELGKDPNSDRLREEMLVGDKKTAPQKTVPQKANDVKAVSKHDGRAPKKSGFVRRLRRALGKSEPRR